MGILLACMSAPSSTWISQAPADDFWKLTLFLLAATIGGFIGAFYFFLRKRIIEDTPTSKASSAAQGYVELSGHGKLIEGSTISGPLTGTVCTWYSYTIEEHRSSGKNSRWVTIEKNTSESLFLLIDKSGEVVIDPENANVTPSTTDVWYGHSRHPQHNSSSTRKKKGLFSFGIGSYRYTEKRMHPDDPLYAIGLFSTTGGAGIEHNTNAEVSYLLKEWKENSTQLLARFDENNDGKVDLAEWQKVREAALTQVREQHQELKNNAPVHMLSKTLDARRPYLLSALPEHALVKRYTWYATALIIIFFVAGILTTWMIGIRLSG